MYPLNSKYEMFTHNNTKPITDERIIELVDSVKYSIGRCYSNVEEIVSVLRKNKYKVDTYVGWLFVTTRQLPIHHCWAVINENELIDISDDFSTLFSKKNCINFEKGLTMEEILVSFYNEALKHKHSERCNPLGQATDGLLYVGSKCDPKTGKIVYNNLIRQFPNHECHRNVDNKTGLNKTQSLLKANGLM